MSRPTSKIVQIAGDSSNFITLCEDGSLYAWVLSLEDKTWISTLINEASIQPKQESPKPDSDLPEIDKEDLDQKFGNKRYVKTNIKKTCGWTAFIDQLEVK